MSDMRIDRRHAAGRRLVMCLVAMLAIGTAAVGALHLAGDQRQRYVTAVDMDGHAVVPDPDARVTTAEAAAMHITATELRLRVPSVGLDVPVDALTAVNGTITPPGFAQAYWVRNAGVAPADAASGTVFLVTHSTRGGAVAPGNYLIDIDAAASVVASGAWIELGDLHYRVTGSSIIAKTAIAGQASVWANVPGRLQLITCLQRSTRANVPSVSNVVITAQLDQGASTVTAHGAPMPPEVRP